MRKIAVGLAAATLVLSSSPVWADSLFTEGPNENLTGFARPYLGVGNLITVVVTERTIAESSALTNRRKDGRIRTDFDFGGLIPGLLQNATDIRGRDDFQGEGLTSRNGRLQMDVTARIEEVLPNGTLRIVGSKLLRVNDEETNITIRGIVRPLDISPDNRIDSSRVADANIDVKGSGPATAKATPGLLTRLFNWLW
ncbi:MAG: flagellar basal body L-ring protein FlgH [Candidatus Sericytochromatia bacterium]|nr:flagellar basal body L-ring protein FlgH [Candidatus Sericytochromatia bacterium]